MKKPNGFTLIELLIVIVIIAILATLLLANFAGIRQRARDGQRKSNLRQIQTALELVRADYGCYPDSACSPIGGDVGLNGDCGVPLAAGGTTYMQSVPCDPLGNNGLSTGSPANTKAYRYTATTQAYSLYACLENPNDPEIDIDASNTSFVCDASKNRYRYKLTNP